MARRPRQLPPEGKPAKDLGPLRMIWREALKYPRQVAIALVALLISSAATLAIPYRFLVMIVVVLGLASAIRFYFVSWLGERVVADLRARVQTNLLRLSPGFFEENSP